MDPWLFERLLGIVALLAASGFFSGTETALLSLSRVKREAMANRNEARDRSVLELLDKPRRLIVTIILCNELVNVGFSTLAAGLGEHAAHRFGVTRPLWVTLVTAAITVPLLVVVGDMTPKTVALRLADRWARAVAPILRVIAVILAPVRGLVRLVSELVINLLGGHPPGEQEGIREAEFRALVDVGEQEGEVEVAERRLIHNVFEFGDRTVGEVMTRGDQLFTLPYDMPLGRLVEAVARSRYSRVPIVRSPAKGGKPRPEKTRHRDEVVGVLHVKDLLGYHRGALEGHTVGDLLRPAFFVPRSTKCDRLFREFQKRRTHLALVVDEYGGLVGAVSMEDLLQELFGEMADGAGASP